MLIRIICEELLLNVAPCSVNSRQFFFTFNQPPQIREGLLKNAGRSD